MEGGPCASEDRKMRFVVRGLMAWYNRIDKSEVVEVIINEKYLR